MNEEIVLKRILKIISDAQLEYDYCEEISAFRITTDTKDGEPLILLSIVVTDFSIIVSTGFRYIVPEETRNQVLLFINHINNNTCDGKLILDTDRDIIFYMRYEDFHVRLQITDKELKEIIFGGACIIDNVGRLLVSIINGEITAEETYDETEAIMIGCILEWAEHGCTVPSIKKRNHYPISPEEYLRLEFHV